MQLAKDRKQWKISHFAVGPGQKLGQQNSGAERAADAARLGDALRVSSVAAGDSGGCGAFSRNLLSGCQLASSWANCWTWSYGPRTRSARSSGQRHLRLSVGAQRAAAAMRGSHTVNKYQIRIGL